MRGLTYPTLPLVSLLAGCVHVSSNQPQQPPTPVASQPVPSTPSPVTIVPTPPSAAPPVQSASPSESVKPHSAAAPAKNKTSAGVPVKPPRAAAPALPAAPVTPAPTATAAPKPQLDFKAMEQRLRDTSAIGVFTKLSIKNQVDDLLKAFRGFHSGRVPPTLDELHQRYDGLLLKVVTLVQDDDATLASSISASRDAIWEILSNKASFQAI